MNDKPVKSLGIGPSLIPIISIIGTVALNLLGLIEGVQAHSDEEYSILRGYNRHLPAQSISREFPPLNIGLNGTYSAIRTRIEGGKITKYEIYETVYRRGYDSRILYDVNKNPITEKVKIGTLSVLGRNILFSPSVRDVVAKVKGYYAYNVNGSSIPPHVVGQLDRPVLLSAKEGFHYEIPCEIPPGAILNLDFRLFRY